MSSPDLPNDVVEAVERLTRLARDAVDQDESRAYKTDRNAVLAEHGYEARIREGDDGDVLVLYPAEWLEDGVIQIEAIEDRSRAVEISLSGTDSTDDWDSIATHNRVVAAAVESEHGPVHGATARALADFASNHYAKPIETLTRTECREFREEYFERNVWPSDAQRERVEESIRLARKQAQDRTEV